MKLTNICVSLELAKKLKEAGYPQRESLFQWISENEYADDWEERVESVDYHFDCPIKYLGSAPTVAELGEALLDFPYPATFITKWYEDGVYLDIKFNRGFKHSYKLNKTRSRIWQKINKFQIENLEKLPDTEANARAKMWLYLKKEGLLKPTKD